MKQLKNPLIWLITSLSLAGCGSLFGPIKQRPVENFTIIDSQINYQQSECPSTQNDNVLYVAKMTAYPPYDTNKMFYTNNPYELNSYGYSQWATSVTDMMTQEVAKKIATSCTFKNMVGINSLADANYRLSSILIGVREEVGLNKDDTSYAHLIIGTELVQMDNNKVIGAFLFDQKESTEVSPIAYAQAVSSLLTKYNNQLVPWLQQKTK